MQKDLSIIILAAGKGSRMKSDLPKVMHKIAGRAMLNMVIDEAKKLHPQEITIVISDDLAPFSAQILSEHDGLTKINFILQKERRGTADAVKTALHDKQKLAKKILILYGDTPLLHQRTLNMMLEKIEDHAALCVLGFDCHEKNSYGRLVVNANGHLEKIIEFKDAVAHEREISLCNSGVMALHGEIIKALLLQVKNNNAAQEFYLTDVVGIACKLGLKCSFIKTDKKEVLGVNSRVELALLEQIKQEELRLKHMEAGVTLLDPSSVYFSHDTKIAHDVVINPQVFFGANVVIEKNVVIKSFCHIEGAYINEEAVVGPFARIRPHAKIGVKARVGNFVEVKNSVIKKGAKINHLAYVGDSEIGVEANIGAGVITCNYDGYEKHKTEIGDKVFIGSNSALVAPVKIGDGALIAAGSVITKDVAMDDLAFARARQSDIVGGAKKFRDKKK